MIFPRKRVEGLLLLFGFMVLGGFEVERGFIAEGRGLRKKESRVQCRAVESWKRVWSRGHLHFWRWTLDARQGLRPIIHLPDLEIRILLPPNAMPPAIHIMRERPRPHLTETVEPGPRQGWEPARESRHWGAPRKTAERRLRRRSKVGTL